MIRKKKIVPQMIVIAIAAASMLAGCSVKIDMNSGSEKNAGSSSADQAPDINQIRNICELATLKCQYHNIAKSVKHPGSGLLHTFEKERKFWIEYQGTVEISFDVSKLIVDQNGENIEITLPEPQLECSIVPNSWSEDSYIVEPDQWIQKNPITAEDQTNAVNQAQQDMEKQVRNNSSLIRTAEMQAEELITNYIEQIGNATGVDYHVTWNTADGVSETVNSSSGR